MTPARIVERAAEMGLDIIGISDHNSAENVRVAVEAAARRGLTAFPSMEITSSEEAHLLAVFDSADAALDMQALVYENLDPGVNDDRLWGTQVVVNADDEVMGFNRRLLIGATRLSLARLIDEVHRRGGLAVASHVDREAFSVISQLGFIPPELAFDALEVVGRGGGLADLGGAPRVRFSDAHRLEDIGRRKTFFTMEEASVAEMALALRGAGGRGVAGGAL